MTLLSDVAECGNATEGKGSDRLRSVSQLVLPGGHHESGSERFGKVSAIRSAS
jgi:hypothetical protein